MLVGLFDLKVLFKEFEPKLARTHILKIILNMYSILPLIRTGTGPEILFKLAIVRIKRSFYGLGKFIRA